jgi:hypothetical protein
VINLGWVDFSKSDRDMTLSVLRQLTEPGAVDELGIGTIRDAFSDMLFPGASTIQTRAKYMFLVPYICMELERSEKLLPQEFIASLDEEEAKLITILLSRAGSGQGVIGEQSREKLKRKPSSIYWNALRTYGFFTEPLTLTEYATLFCARRNASNDLKKGGKHNSRNEEDAVDDSDTWRGDTAFWRVPAVRKDWREDVSIELTAGEAAFMREKIISMPKVRDSLLALVLRENRKEFCDFAEFRSIDSLQDLMPDEMRNIYRLARDFSAFIFGAQVRYNVIYSDGQNDEASELWEAYLEERPTVDLGDVRMLLHPHGHVMKFLERFASALDDEQELDALIIRREKELKGPARSKLTNKDLYQYDGDNVNMEPLAYRMGNVRRIVRDIFEGMNRNA